MKLYHLINRSGKWHYKRRVPEAAIDLDERAPMIQFSLKTSDLQLALQRRDAYDLANQALWDGLIRKDDAAWRRYEAAVNLASTLGHAYKTESELVNKGDLNEILSRIEGVTSSGSKKVAADALLGFQERPKHTISSAFDLYVTKIAADDVRGKSPEQAHQWLKTKLRAKNNFIKVVSDKAVLEVNRDDALKFYEHWRDRINKGEVVADTGNRDVGNMRVLISEYCKYFGLDMASNPFENLNFRQRFKKKRTPFSVNWIRNKILSPNALKDLHPELRAILFICIDAGVRPGEASNLLAEQIVLDNDVPHIFITPILEGENMREIKTQSSVRQVPLVGLALEAVRDNPKGFGHYRGRGNLLSANFAGWLKRNELRETKGRSLYCLRHSFEDRMKVAGVDSELREILMGHTSKRPQYGAGGGLKWQRDELQKIVW